MTMFRARCLFKGLSSYRDRARATWPFAVHAQSSNRFERMTSVAQAGASTAIYSMVITRPVTRSSGSKPAPTVSGPRVPRLPAATATGSGRCAARLLDPAAARWRRSFESHSISTAGTPVRGRGPNRRTLSPRLWQERRARSFVSPVRG